VSKTSVARARVHRPTGRPSTAPSRDLKLLDFTLLVIGAVIGADVYVVAAIGASLLGPAQLAAWLVAGLLAALIGLAFVQCAAIYPQVGGSYAYARTAFGSLVGFLCGWALYVGEWIALPVFPVAFANYLTFFFPNLDPTGLFIVKAVLIAVVTFSNILGARTGARINDVLTIAKLVPLAVLICAGLAFLMLRPGLAATHMAPFAPLGWSGFGASVLVIFWAYAGFELAVLPAGEVKAPRRTLPRGLVLGMVVATLFYLLTALAVVAALPWSVAAESPRSLADALDAIMAAFGLTGGFGGALMSLGALVSIAGVYEVFTLGVARLSYALARDGLFPQPFGRLHNQFGTPYVGLTFQALAALVLASFLDLTHLISTAMFFLGLCFAVTALAALRLIKRAPDKALHLPALRGLLPLASLGGIVLAAQAPPMVILMGAAVMGVGLVGFIARHGARRTRSELETSIRRDEQEFEVWLREHQHWLLRFSRR
jgi:APA family basic amino acid/polyamine antiporter